MAHENHRASKIVVDYAALHRLAIVLEDLSQVRAKGSKIRKYVEKNQWAYAQLETFIKEEPPKPIEETKKNSNQQNYSCWSSTSGSFNRPTWSSWSATSGHSGAANSVVINNYVSYNYYINATGYHRTFLSRYFKAKYMEKYNYQINQIYDDTQKKQIMMQLHDKQILSTQNLLSKFSYVFSMAVFANDDEPFTGAVAAPQAPTRSRNHIGFGPKNIVAKHVANGYVPPAQSLVQQLIGGTYVPPVIQQTRREVLRSFEGTVFGRVEVRE